MTTCIEAMNCMPSNPMDVLNLYDVQYGAPMSLIMMALILGGITLSIYARSRSLPMLAILGIYEFAAFGSILLSKYVSSQYHIMIYVTILAGATGLVMLILKLMRE